MGYKMDLLWTYQNHVDKLMTSFGPQGDADNVDRATTQKARDVNEPFRPPKNVSPHRIYGTIVYLPTWIVDVYGFHVNMLYKVMTQPWPFLSPYLEVTFPTFDFGVTWTSPSQKRGTLTAELSGLEFLLAVKTIDGVVSNFQIAISGWDCITRKKRGLKWCFLNPSLLKDMWCNYHYCTTQSHPRLSLLQHKSGEIVITTWWPMVVSD